MRRVMVLVPVALCVLAACDQGPRRDPVAELPATITLTSPDLRDGEPIPRRHTCDGGDSPPLLRWQGVPAEAAELVVLVEDPDAPRGVYVHWIVAGLPPSTGELSGTLPEGAVEGRNGFGELGWTGPCPPRGDQAHRYVFTVVAVRRFLGLRPGVSISEARAALAEDGLARGRLVATYGR